MPKTKTNYSKTVIYKIVCDDDNVKDLYVGSTTEFVKRKYQHKNACNNEKSISYNQKLYKIIRDNGGWENWRMIEVEKFPCNDKREAEYREEYWRKNLKAELNGQRCWRNIICLEEGCETGSIIHTDYCKKHGGGRRCIETDCTNSAMHPTDFCLKHGGGIRCIYKDCENSAMHPTDFCKKHGEQYTCECGSILSIKSKNRHNKTKKHQKYLSTL